MVRRSRYAAALDRDPASGARRGVEEGGSKIETITPPPSPPRFQRWSNTLSLSSNVRGILKDVCEKRIFLSSPFENVSRETRWFFYLYSFFSRFFFFSFFLEHFWTNKVSQEFSHWSRIRHRIATLSFLASGESLFFSSLFF